MDARGKKKLIYGISQAQWFWKFKKKKEKKKKRKKKYGQRWTENGQIEERSDRRRTRSKRKAYLIFSWANERDVVDNIYVTARDRRD